MGWAQRLGQDNWVGPVGGSTHGGPWAYPTSEQLQMFSFKVKMWGSLLSPLFGRFQNGCARERVLKKSLQMILIECGQLVWEERREERKGGGCVSKARHRVIWKSTPRGLLKLNFDGSYLRSICRGGIGGAIRDSSNGNVVRSFSGPFDGKDANEAEVFALLIGYRELSRLDGYKAIIEGDSFPVIQWGLGKSSHPWRIADGWRRCTIFLISWMLNFIIFKEKQMSWQIVLLRREFFTLFFLLMFSSLLYC